MQDDSSNDYGAQGSHAGGPSAPSASRAAHAADVARPAGFALRFSPQRPAGRFAPTPSGRMHLGNLFCAMLAWLSAKSKGYRFVLRIEDLDVVASKQEYIPALLDDLSWLGVTWDEGPFLASSKADHGVLGDGGAGGGSAIDAGGGEDGDHCAREVIGTEDASAGNTRPIASDNHRIAFIGDCGPYEQHECSAIYERAFSELCERSHVYPCFCSRADVHAASAPHASDGQAIYGGACRGLAPDEIALRSKAKAPAWRIEVPREVIEFDDMCQGHRAFDLTSESGDFIIRRSDGLFAYQLAVVVDDARMGIAEVVRGSDLLSSTPRQILLQRILGYEQPAYAHVPLLIAPDGRRLAKRDRDCDAGELRKRFCAEEVTGKLACACGLRGTSAPVALSELVDGFSWEAVRPQAIVIDDGFFD